jgi:hypothetical protein
MPPVNPESVRQSVEQSHRIGVRFLLADIDVALTFLAGADVTRSEDSRKRNRQSALRAYETVTRLLPRLSPSGEEQIALNNKLQELKNRLVALGCLDTPEDAAPSAT